EEDARACLAAAAALESVERELAAAHETREVYQELVRHLVSEVARLRREAARSEACERAALGLLAEWRATSSAEEGK
ncbi:hypothetical protein DVS31_12070, partial [Limosilactobacillus fermentum]|nr:hypothetical protein [Limosilactobacillus fermentum]